MNKEVMAGKHWIHYGVSWHQIGLGIVISKWHLNIDIGPFWFGLEW